MKTQALITVLFLFMACQPKEESHEISTDSHEKEISTWHADRVESLKKEDGWLNLIGLFWLGEGPNTFGSGDSSNLKLEEGNFPSNIGVFTLQNGEVYFEPKVEGINLDNKGLEETTVIFSTSMEGAGPALSLGTLRFNIIKRADAYGLRVRDLEAASVKEFSGIDRYPVSLDWRLIGQFVPYEPSKEIPITNVIGQTTPNLSPGYVSFEKDGKTYTLDALDAGEELYLIFADATSGSETYGGGRYLYIPKPKAGSDVVVIDFNKAYNPPCVFTPHATCPLPPRQNMLELPIEAGEKNFGKH